MATETLIFPLPSLPPLLFLLVSLRFPLHSSFAHSLTQNLCSGTLDRGLGTQGAGVCEEADKEGALILPPLGPNLNSPFSITRWRTRKFLIFGGFICIFS